MKYFILIVAMFLAGCHSNKGDDMTIGIIADAEAVGAYGVVETKPTFNNSSRAFAKNLELLDGDYIYKRAGADFTAEDFDSNTAYDLNKVVYKEGHLHYVSENVVGTVALQPESYSALDSNIEPSTWSNRYLNVGNFQDNRISIITQGGYRYEFTLDGVNVTTRIYRVDSESEEIYTHTDYVCKFVDGQIGSTAKVSAGKCNYAYDLDTDNFQISVVYNVNGLSLRVKAVRSINDWTHAYVEVYDELVHESTISALTSSTLSVAEIEAIKMNDNEFIPYTYIIRANVLYLRTSVDAIQETRTTTEVETTELKHINEVEWGWAKYKPSNKKAPFDNLKYTVLEANNTIAFNVKTTSPADTIALNGLTAKDVEVFTQQLYDNNNYVYVASSDSDLILKYNGDVIPIVQDNRSSAFNGGGIYRAISDPSLKIAVLGDISLDIGTETITFGFILMRDGKKVVVNSSKIKTKVIYLDDKITNFAIEITPMNNKLKVGEIVAGEREKIGNTDLGFSNSIKDLSPRIVNDIDGEIEYHRSIVKRVFDGTAQIRLEEYDTALSLFIDIAGQKVFFDGNDNVDNKPSDSVYIFDAVQIIGRVGNVKQSTKVRKGRLDDLATYSFTIEEDV